MKVIGLTGNIGSGKSEVSKMLAELGAAVIDADKVGHCVIESDGPGYHLVAEAFGRDFLLPDGKTDRKAIGAFVFSDETGRRVEILNGITHPLITEFIRRQLTEYQDQGYSHAVIEAALLFDSALSSMTDENWVVYAPENMLIQRAMDRDACSSSAVLARLKQQRSSEELRALADRVIVNDGSMDTLKERVAATFNEMIGE